MQMRGKRSLLRNSLQFWVTEGRSHPFCNSSVLFLECGGQRDNFSTLSASEGRLSSMHEGQFLDTKVFLFLGHL